MHIHRYVFTLPSTKLITLVFSQGQEIHSGTESQINFPLSFLMKRYLLSLKIRVISFELSSTSKSSWPFIPSNLTILNVLINIRLRL
jgi:hypothetical protein